MTERKAIICYMFGWIQSTGKKRPDALIILDNILFKMNQPRVQPEELEYLNDLDAEIDWFLLSMGISSKRAKEIARTGKL